MNLVKNIEKYLDKHYEFYNDVVKERTYFRKKGLKNLRFKLLTEKHINSITREMLKKDQQVSKKNLMDLINSDYVESINPLTNFFDQLPVWDGKDYILQLANTVSTTNDDFFQWAFKKWLVAMVACAIDDDIINQAALIFVGMQGVGKSRWFENQLIPEELKPYIFSKRINPADKDHILQLSENILLNMEEIGTFNMSQNEAFKELITKATIRERRAYGIYSENYVRRASFSGTSNNRHLLNDITGNRRFLVFEALEFRFQTGIDLNMVYAQALYLYKNEFQYWFDSEDINKINENNLQFTQVSETDEIINKYFELPDESETEIHLMNASEIATYIYQESRGTGTFRLNAVVIGKSLTAKGFKEKNVYEGKNKIKKYIVKLIK